MTMTSADIRKRFVSFFEKRGHAILPSAPLVPENDPSVLFNTAGMQPLVPYLLGQKHPLGARLVNFQKCVRTVDIEDVGDNTHATFFEMMGNWSLGDYFKEDAIKWSYELLTSKEEGFGLDPKRLYVTVFEGDENAPRDDESALIWKKVFDDNSVNGERIFYMGADDNWWSPGENGPCGPDTEMFYDVTGSIESGLTKEQFLKSCDKQDLVEIWNNVFMEYIKKDGKVTGKLESKNVDTGSGFERVTMVLQGKNNIFDTDIFMPIMDKIGELTTSDDTKSKRIIADHVRAATFLISDGVIPSNKDQGYVLRRLLRRAVRDARELKLGEPGVLAEVASVVIETHKNSYPNLEQNKENILREIRDEEVRFNKTLAGGLEELKKMKNSNEEISAEDAFMLFTSYGFPLEITKEFAKISDEEEFWSLIKKHQELSRAGAEQKFKGGLAGTGVVETRYHTATHLLNAALREILGTHVSQKGSNITAERMRFDFSHPQKMTDEEKKKVEDLVNQKIQEAHPVSFQELPREEAEKLGAVHAFGDKYGDIVKVYSIGNETDGYFSREFCGGPHIENTSELGHFKIVKEEAVSQGVRRIKAVLE